MVMFRITETYGFELTYDGDDGPGRLPCRIEITSRRDIPDVDPCHSPIDSTNDARLSMITRSVITEEIARHLDGQPLDGPILDLESTDHAPERIAVWAYHLANDQSRHEREVTGGNLMVESARVVSCGRWMVEYAPTDGGDR